MVVNLCDFFSCFVVYLFLCGGEVVELVVVLCDFFSLLCRISV